MEEKKPTVVNGQTTGDFTESGNNNHKKDGTFAPKDATTEGENLEAPSVADTSEKSEDDKVLDDLLGSDNESETDDIESEEDLADFLMSGDNDIDLDSEYDLDDVSSSFGGKIIKKKISEYTDDEVIDTLDCIMELDNRKVRNLDFDDRRKLLYAYTTIFENEMITKTSDAEVFSEKHKMPWQVFWYGLTPKEYVENKIIDAGDDAELIENYTSGMKAKDFVEFQENFIKEQIQKIGNDNLEFNKLFGEDDPFFTDNETQAKELQEKLDRIEQFKKDCEAYEQLKEKTKYQQEIYDYNSAKAYLKQFENPNQPYSITRKDKAAWLYYADPKKVEAHIGQKNIADAFVKCKEVADYGFSQAEWNHINNTKKQNYNVYAETLANHLLQNGVYSTYEEALKYSKMYCATQHYIGGSSYLNEPLRNKTYVVNSNHPDYTEQTFVNDCNALTQMMDENPIENDIWVVRGVNELTILNDGVNSKPRTLNSYNDNEAELFQELLGTTFKDQGFLSCRTSKKAEAFSSRSIQLHIYCPRGTKAIYLNRTSNFGNNEDETVISRGYSYKITRIRRSGGKILLDCEVILDSDKNRYHDMEKHVQDKWNG